jgi:pimeloyl-ACP methyl ester carboxylesterase
MSQFANQGQRTTCIEKISVKETARTLVCSVRIPRPQNTLTPAFLGLPFETGRISAKNGHVEVWVIRNDEAFAWGILFHGYSSSKDSFLEVAARLHRLGMSVVLVDFHGSGGSLGSTTTIGFSKAQDVADAVRWVRETYGVPAPVLYGFSMGAAAILRAVAFHRVHARALIWHASFDRMLTTVKHRFEMLHVPTFPAAELLVFWGGKLNQFNAFLHNPKDYAMQVTIPSLVLHGELDTRVTTEEAQSIFNALRGKKVFHAFPTGVHDPVTEVPEAQWVDVVGSFLLRKVSAASGR